MIIDYSFALFGFTVTTIIFVCSRFAWLMIWVYYIYILWSIIYGLCNKRHELAQHFWYQNVRRIGLVDGILINLLLVMQYMHYKKLFNYAPRKLSYYFFVSNEVKNRCSVSQSIDLAWKGWHRQSITLGKAHVILII